MAKRKKLLLTKPEEVIVARHKVAKKAIPKKQPKRPTRRPKKVVHWRRFLRFRVRKDVFYSLISIILAFTMIVTWIQVRASIRDTNKNLTASSRTADATYLVAKKEADLIRIIGTKTQRQNEIKNFQSAPIGLQKFIASDYRTFKQQCIANGKLSNDVGYEVSNVIYDSYAVVKRTCNGTSTAILKNFNGKWATAFSGNVNPPCTVTNDLDIPQGASYYCEQNGVIYINPNP